MGSDTTAPAGDTKGDKTMYLVIDTERNFLLLATRDMLSAYQAADMSESKGIATIVRFDSSFRQ